MFFHIDPLTYRDEWVASILKAPDGVVIDVNVCRLINAADVPADALTGCNGRVLVVIVDRDLDRAALAFRFMEWLTANGHVDALRWRVHNIMKSWAFEHRNTKAVQCVETGETWSSLKDAARAHNIDPAALSRHLRGVTGFKTVKGRTYQRGGK